MARFIDPCSTAAIFEVPLKRSGDSTVDSDKVLVAQQAAEKVLLDALSKRIVMESLQGLCDTYRRLKSRPKEDCWRGN